MSDFHLGDELPALGRVRARETGAPSDDWERHYERLQQRTEVEAAWRRLRAVLLLPLTFRLPSKGLGNRPLLPVLPNK